MVSVLVRKLVVICSGRMEPSLDLTIALDMEGFASLLGDAPRLPDSLTSRSATSRTRLPESELEEEGFSSCVAERVRSGWRLLRPDVLLTMKRSHLLCMRKVKSYIDCLFIPLRILPGALEMTDTDQTGLADLL